jgi:hypothetical protein
MAEWDRFGLDGARPSSISVVQLSGNWERGGKVNWFVFPGHSERPALVAKIARSCTDAGRVKHEHEMLLWLRSLADAVSSHIPAPLALWEISGHFVSLQQAAAYPPVSAALRGDRADAAVLRALRLCVPFLTELALATRSDLPPGADHPYLGELSDQALLAAGNPLYPPLTCGLLRGLARLVQTGQQEHCAPFAVVHHGDMSAGDFLSDGGEFQVIDWEGGIRQGLPFVDLVHLGISVASAAGPAAVASTMRALVTPTESDATSFGGAGELASAYCASLGLSDSERRPLAAAAVLNLMVRMPDSRLSELRLTLPSDEVPSIAAAKVLVEPVAQVP